MPPNHTIQSRYKLGYGDAAVLFGLIPCPEPPPFYVTEAREAGTEFVFVIAKDQDLELSYFRDLDANIFYDRKLVDAGFDINEDPFHPGRSLTDICCEYFDSDHPAWPSSAKHNETFKVVTSRSRPKKNGKTKKIFRGAHDGSNDGFWTMKAFLAGVFYTARIWHENRHRSLHKSSSTPFEFPLQFRALAVDFEGGNTTARQIGITELSSEDVKNTAFYNWNECMNVFSIKDKQQRHYKNAWCLPDTDPQFCSDTWVDDSEALGKWIVDFFARRPLMQPHASQLTLSNIAKQSKPASVQVPRYNLGEPVPFTTGGQGVVPPRRSAPGASIGAPGNGRRHSSKRSAPGASIGAPGNGSRRKRENSETTDMDDALRLKRKKEEPEEIEGWIKQAWGFVGGDLSLTSKLANTCPDTLRGQACSFKSTTCPWATGYHCCRDFKDGICSSTAPIHLDCNGRSVIHILPTCRFLLNGEVCEPKSGRCTRSHSHMKLRKEAEDGLRYIKRGKNEVNSERGQINNKIQASNDGREYLTRAERNRHGDKRRYNRNQ